MKGFKGLLLLILLSWVVVISACLFVLGTSATAEASVMYVGVAKGSTLNGRAEPTTDSSRVCYFNRGDELTILSIKDGWAQVDASTVGIWVLGHSDDICYVSTEFLKPTRTLILTVEEDVTSAK